MHKANLLCALFLLSSCTQIQVATHVFKKTTGVGIYGNGCVAEGKGPPKVGNPYKINGIRYVPLSTSTGYRQQGIASWYGADFHGKPTANGECYDMYSMTAAHTTLPLPTKVRVTNLENNRSIVVTVNDRGPFAKGRLIDLSYAAAQRLGMAKQGVAPVLVEAIGGAHHDQEKRGLTRRMANLFHKEQTPDPVITPQASAPTPQPRVAAGSFTQRVTEQPAPVQGTASQPEHKLTENIREQLPPPPENVPSTSSRTLAGGTELYVQTGAFGSMDNAQKQLKKLQGAGHIGLLTEYQQSGGPLLHRVRVGPFTTISQADSALAGLVNAGFNTAVIVVEKN